MESIYFIWSLLCHLWRCKQAKEQSNINKPLPHYINLPFTVDLFFLILFGAYYVIYGDVSKLKSKAT